MKIYTAAELKAVCAQHDIETWTKTDDNGRITMWTNTAGVRRWVDRMYPGDADALAYTEWVIAQKEALLGNSNLIYRIYEDPEGASRNDQS